MGSRKGSARSRATAAEGALHTARVALWKRALQVGSVPFTEVKAATFDERQLVLLLGCLRAAGIEVTGVPTL